MGPVATAGVCLASAMTLAACATQPEPRRTADPAESKSGVVAISTSSWRPGDGSRGALITGVLRSDASGCPYLSVGRTSRLWVAWPAGFRVRLGPGGLIALLDENGRLIAEEGQFVRAGGSRAGSDADTRMPCIPAGVSVAYVQSKVHARTTASGGH